MSDIICKACGMTWAFGQSHDCLWPDAARRWRVRAEKAEAEVKRLRSVVAALRRENGGDFEDAYDETAVELENVTSERDELRTKVERVKRIYEECLEAGLPRQCLDNTSVTLGMVERAVEGRGTKKPKKARRAQNRAKTGLGATNAPDVGVESQGQEKVAEKPETRERRKSDEQLAAEFEAELTRPVVVRFGYRDTGKREVVE